MNENENPGAVIAIGSRCTPKGAGSSTGSPDQVGVNIDEFVEFDDGTRVSIRWDRGCAISLNGFGKLSEQELLEHLEGALLPNEGELKTWANAVPSTSMRSCWRSRVSMQLQGLKNLPYLTELSSDLRAQVQS